MKLESLYIGAVRVIDESNQQWLRLTAVEGDPESWVWYKPTALGFDVLLGTQKTKKLEDAYQAMLSRNLQ